MATDRNIQYEIKRPSKTKGAGKRATFALQKVTYLADNSRTQVTVEDVRIVAINREYTQGDSTFKQADQLMVEVRDSYRAKLLPPGKVVHNSENYKILDRYWAEEYEYRDIKAPKAMRGELENALDTIGTLSLLSATAQDLQAAIASKVSDVNKQRRIAERTNQLLRYVGRPKLKKKKKAAKAIKYLSEAEWEKVRRQIESPIVRLAADISFYASPRLGEVFDLDQAQWQGHQLYIKGSLDRKRKAGPTKTNRPRFAYCCKKGFEALRGWFALPVETRNKDRNLQFAELVREACQRVFPDRPEKWLTLRDFRHCYAIHLIGKGVSISLVAQSMGNSVKTCQEYYAGFSLVPESIANIATMLNE